MAHKRCSSSRPLHSACPSSCAYRSSTFVLFPLFPPRSCLLPALPPSTDPFSLPPRPLPVFAVPHLTFPPLQLSFPPLCFSPLLLLFPLLTLPFPSPPSSPPGGGSEVNVRDGYGQAPIHVATKNLDLPTMGVLLDHGAAVDAAMEPDGRMPM